MRETGFHRRRHLLAIALVALIGAMGAASDEPVDLDAVQRIKQESFERSQVMEIASYLTDVHGPRLTGSPNIRAAREYAMQKLAAFGLEKPRLERWGHFGRGWTNDRFVAHAVAPQAYPLIGYPKAWTPGTNGTITGEAILAIIDSDKDMEAFRGRLRGKFVLTAPMREVKAQFDPPADRYTDDELRELAAQRNPAAQRRRPYRTAEQIAFAAKRNQFFASEGVLALIDPGRGDGGTVFVGGGGSRDPKDPPVPPQVVLSIEHYGRIARTLAKKIPVTLEMNIRNTFHDEDPAGYNVVAEIPGIEQAAEIVMLGAHLDSWHAGTGATDNAAGSAVVMEAVRILKATGLEMRRTVRVALWDGEEQGLLGSRAYVKNHFADRDTMIARPEHARLSAYFNVDNGTGAIRGVYLQGNEAVAPIFGAWMEPFRALGMTTVTMRSTGGTDHLAFDAVGLPGFQFIQDEVEYDSRTHHSNMDVYERIQERDMMQNAAIVASFVYHAANRADMLPRKPLPRPQTAAGQTITNTAATAGGR